MKTIILSNTDKVTIISDIDYERVSQYHWYLKSNGHGGFYICRGVRRKSKVMAIYLHRFIMQPDDGYDIHHRDGDIFNNQRENLELIDHALHNYKDPYARGWAEYVEQNYG